MIETVAIYVGKAAASAVFDAIKKKLLGIEYQDVSIEDWGQTAVLAVFFQQSMRPELAFEKRAELRMDKLQQQIDGLKRDLDTLKKDMSAYEWRVDAKFYKAREEALWSDMLKLNNDA